jgi:hypothetical protein
VQRTDKTELFREKEPSDTIKTGVDPDEGLTLDIDYQAFLQSETNSHIMDFKKTHLKEDQISPIIDMEHSFKMVEEDSSSIVLPDEFGYLVIPVEDLINFLDSSEKEV